MSDSSSNSSTSGQHAETSRGGVTFGGSVDTPVISRAPPRLGSASPQSLLNSANEGSLLSCSQQQQHIASSSVGATEGSPPSSPRSTFSSVHSYGLDAYSPAVPLGGSSMDLLAPQCRQHTSASVFDIPSQGQVACQSATGDLMSDSEANLQNGFYEVNVSTSDFKFCCAHFCAYKGFRENIHGHNYTVGVKIGGLLGPDGYVLDFDDMKTAIRDVCKSMNHLMIVPMRSDALDISQDDRSITIRCEDGSEFKFPRGDCLCIPIVHSSAEEISAYVWHRVADILTLNLTKKRRIKWMEVTVCERPGQSGAFRRNFT